MIRDYFRGIMRDRYILMSLVDKDLQLKYKGSVIGVGWAVLTPLGLVVIIGTVYSILFSADPREFIPALFAGLNPWIFMSGAADAGTGALIAAEGYLKQTAVNAQIFPLRIVMVTFVNLLYSIAAFFIIYLLISPASFNPRMLMVLPGLLIVFLFALGMANIGAIVNLRIRDYQPLQGLVFQGLFYATPIIYRPEMLGQKGFSFIYEINPFYYMIEILRRPMMGEPLPQARVYLIAAGLAAGLFLFSIFLLMRDKKNISLYL